MARTGITFEQVAIAAETLAMEGIQPTIKAVRERLTTGSPNTIHEHLKQWKASKTNPTTKPLNLPEALNTAIAAAIAKAAEEAKEDLENQLEEAKKETDEIASYTQNLEAENEELKQKIILMARKNNILEGKNEELAKEVERLRNQLEAETKERIKAEQSAAVAQAKFEVIADQFTIKSTEKPAKNTEAKAFGGSTKAINKISRKPKKPGASNSQEP